MTELVVEPFHIQLSLVGRKAHNEKVHRSKLVNYYCTIIWMSPSVETWSKSPFFFVNFKQICKVLEVHEYEYPPLSWEFCTSG